MANLRDLGKGGGGKGWSWGRWMWADVVFPSFQKFFQRSVSVTQLSIFSPFLKFISRSFFVLTGQPNQYRCQATKCYTRIWMHPIFLGCDFFAAPVFCFWAGCCPGAHTQGQVEWSSESLCAPQRPRRFLQLTSRHVRSCSVAAERQSPCSGGELAFLHPWPWGAGLGVGRIPECSCPAGFTSERTEIS